LTHLEKNLSDCDILHYSDFLPLSALFLVSADNTILMLQFLSNDAPFFDAEVLSEVLQHFVLVFGPNSSEWHFFNFLY
jgi:hypothetical protein